MGLGCNVENVVFLRSLGGRRLAARGGFYHTHVGRPLQRCQESAAEGPFVTFQQPAAAGGGRSIGMRCQAPQQLAGVGLVSLRARVVVCFVVLFTFLGNGPTNC